METTRNILVYLLPSDNYAGIKAVNESLNYKRGQISPTGANEIFMAKLFDDLI